jgi:hypothetical protein
MDELIPPKENFFTLRVAILDGDVFEFPAATEQAAKNAIERIEEYGLWVELKKYPVHRLDYCEIIPPGGE